MTRDSSVGRAEDCSWYDADILRSPVRLRFAGCGFFFNDLCFVSCAFDAYVAGHTYIFKSELLFCDDLYTGLKT